ncbi:bacterial Ig-like domain-containing protein [Bifidobacterium sp. UMB1197]|nr:bacterial Ig-like domain-containing protein [Bifidobacterium sp. UMB1197]
MKIRMKGIMGLFLALAVSIGCLSLNPIASYANDAGTTFNINDSSVNITQSGTYTIKGTGHATSNTISVTGSNIKAKIILKNVNIDVSNQDEQQAFLAKNNDQSNVHLTIILEGTNSLKSGDHRAGLTWNNSDNNSTLEIEGDGSLTATGGWSGAGIGGGYGGSSENIKITGGTVTATGGTFGAGIGGGGGDSGKNIKITGGTVTATGGWAGAGIGGGDADSGRNITITGGTVKASSISVTPTDGKGNNVYLFKLKNQDGVNEVTVDSGTGNAKTFTRAGNHPGGDTAFYLYLTGKDHDLDTSKKKYKAEWNNTTNTFTTKFDPNDVKSMTVTTQPSKLSYTEDDPLDLSGLVVTLTDDQGKTKEVKPTDFTANNINADPENGAVLKLGHNEKPVTLKRGNLTATTDALQVKQRVFDPTRVTSRTITHQPKLSYTEGERLDLTGLVVTLTDYQGLRKEVPFAQFERYGINAYPADKTFLKVADHNGKPVKLVIYRPGTGIQSWSAQAGVLKVKNKFDPTHVTSMTVKHRPSKLSYTEGENLDLTGLVVTLKDAKEATKDVTPAEFEANGIKATPENGAKLALTDNTKKVKLTKDGVPSVETEKLTVNKLNPTSMSVTSQPNKLSYTEGENLALDGLVVTLKDDNGVTKTVEPKDFEANGIKATPENGAKLELTDGGKPVKLTRGNLTADTSALKVAKLNPTSMTVTSQPSKLNYTEGEKLDLTGLVVTLTDDNGKTKEVKPADFTANNIKATPENGTELKVADHNGKPVTLTRGNLTATTGALQVKARVFDPSAGAGSSTGMNDDAPATLDNGELNIQIDSAESDYKPGYAGDGAGNANAGNAGNANAGSAPEVKQSDAAVKQSADTLALAQAQVDAATRRLADARKSQSEAPAPKSQHEAPAPKPQREKRIGMIPKKGESASFAGLIALYAGLIAVLGFSIAGLAFFVRRK